ncbi:ABC transporter ATP-binding protein [Parvularcula bermudensis HTCC2503]|uniref:ABC transporter ATP-binding protein n=1 Tax=Parvularcula bermudensis (strain ATCC BAA-594 / HTCC2503 / KCTC 12087) TaxID=314260 RepID=E0THX0_PARBH|nr:ABC transporter ATP-binding protein [Parvularcula bermudensis]ADM10781.1 ABC transporter ATP-binding protein [Parvularcula bermudensis HTCC2503]
MRLKAENLRVARSGAEVLRGISFSVGEGEIYALLGGNGAGKSTTLLTFLGFLAPSGGEVTVNGKSVPQDVGGARQAIAFLPEAASLYEHMNARENLRYFLSLAATPRSSSAIEEALTRVSLAEEARGRKMKGYSKGVRQKVAIALAILRDTDILLMDEPTSGLDPIAIDEFHALTRSLADDGKTVLMVTHDVYGACQVAGRIGLLRRGVLVDEFTAPEGGSIDTETVHRAFAEREAA